MVVVGTHTDENTSTRIGNCCLHYDTFNHKLWMFEFSSIWVYFLSLEGRNHLLNSLKWNNVKKHVTKTWLMSTKQAIDSERQRQEVQFYYTIVYLSQLTFSFIFLYLHF